MAGLSNELEQDVLKSIFKGTAATPATLTRLDAITQIHVTLHSSDPGDTGTSEISGGGYLRVALAPDTGSSNARWSAVTATGSAHEVTNAQAINFPTATAAWNSSAAIKYFGLYDASTGGNFIGGGPINSSTGVIVLNGNQLSFPIGNLHFQID